MTSLRTWQGIDLSFVKARFDKSYVDYLVSNLNRTNILKNKEKPLPIRAEAFLYAILK